MRLLIAPNAFKASLDAAAAADAIARGFRASALACDCRLFPVGDGGDGTGAILGAHLNAESRSLTVRDPLGRHRTSSFAFVRQSATAIIELADASGLKLLTTEERDPLNASTFGTGELIRAALDQGARDILLCVGGSATVDGGAGILEALGVVFRDTKDQPLSRLPGDLDRLERLDLTNLDPRLADTKITLLCDVDNPLLGENGAAAIFGPQKGATPAMIGKLDARLARLSRAIAQATSGDVATLRHGGAAGGTAAGLQGVLNATLVNGIEDFLDRTGFDQALTQADLVVTGEGQLDEQTLSGKAPFGVARRAKSRGLPVIALAGRVPEASSAAFRNVFDVCLAIGDGPQTLADALKTTECDLERTAREIGTLLALANQS